jgi:hypothetical protein
MLSLLLVLPSVASLPLLLILPFVANLLLLPPFSFPSFKNKRPIERSPWGFIFTKAPPVLFNALKKFSF